MRALLFLLVLSVTTACGPDYGHEIHGGKLTVYFNDSKDESNAKELAVFWKENHLMTGEKQDIQLYHGKKGHLLKLIVTDPKAGSELNFQERKLLFALQDSVRNLLALPNLELELCNQRFEALMNINE